MSAARPQQSATDPWIIERPSELLDAAVDPARTICIVAADPEALARAIVALANTRGGEIVLGASADRSGRVATLDGFDPARFAALVESASRQVDPPVNHLIRQRTVSDDGCAVGVMQVRLSPSAPHLVVTDGGIYRVGEDGVSAIRSRRALDDLYARSRGERERADRLIEAMAEKLVLGHYAFYGIAIVACTHQPSAEPYRAAQSDPGWLAPPEDPFIAAAGLHEQELRVNPGEVELRTPGEVNAYVRITRTGCVAAGEVQRRPYHDELDTAAHLHERIERLCVTVGRLLSVTADNVMLPQIFIEGVRGLKLVHDPERRVTSAGAPQDTGRYPLSLGDPHDSEYVGRLPAEAMERLTPLFPPPAT
jgi:hypothetical protein